MCSSDLKGDHYQIDTALQAFGNGGLTGRGPGEGRTLGTSGTETHRAPAGPNPPRRGEDF